MRPVALLSGVGKGGAMHRTAQTQMVKLVVAGVATGFNVAETFAPGQVCEGEADELTPAGKLASPLAMTGQL